MEDSKMTNQEFDALRRENEITSVEIANYAGATVKELLLVETGRAPVQSWMITSLNFLINKKNA
jgi:hypothetical protein